MGHFGYKTGVKKRGETGKGAVLRILQAAYDNCKDKSTKTLEKAALKQIEIAEIWANEQNEVAGKAPGATGSLKKDDIKSTVCRVMGNLTVCRTVETCSEGDLVAIGSRYLINNLDTRWCVFARELHERIDVGAVSACPLSDAVLALKVLPKNVEETIGFFKSFLGTEYCFDIKQWEDLVIIMLLGQADERKDIIERIVGLIDAAHQDKPKTKRLTLKPKDAKRRGRPKKVEAEQAKEQA